MANDDVLGNGRDGFDGGIALIMGQDEMNVFVFVGAGVFIFEIGYCLVDSG